MKPYRIKSISEFHPIFHLPKPEHPLINVVDYALLVDAKKRFFKCITEQAAQDVDQTKHTTAHTDKLIEKAKEKLSTTNCR